MGTLELLRAADIGAGDEVIVPAFGNAEVTDSVIRAGAIPAYADIDPSSYCLDPGAVAAAVNTRTAAVVAVHRFGHPADTASLRALGDRHGLLVLEQAEPGATHDGTAQHRTEQHRSDQHSSDQHDAERRRAHAALLHARLTGVLAPADCPGHTYQQYVVRVPGNGRPDRDAFARAVRARGVACQVPVKTPVHRLPRFRSDVRLPETERAADETLALPVHAALCARDLRRITTACNALGGLLQPA